jgi:hypothetical protein
MPNPGETGVRNLLFSWLFAKKQIPHFVRDDKQRDFFSILPGLREAKTEK